MDAIETDSSEPSDEELAANAAAVDEMVGGIAVSMPVTATMLIMAFTLACLPAHLLVMAWARVFGEDPRDSVVGGWATAALGCWTWMAVATAAVGTAMLILVT